MYHMNQTPITTDCLVIGGGVIGLNIAGALKQRLEMDLCWRETIARCMSSMRSLPPLPGRFPSQSVFANGFSRLSLERN